MTLMADGYMTGGRQHLPAARDLREAVATYARRTWPTDTVKSSARAWGLPLSTAANVLKGHASDTTMSQILRRGGWALAASVVGAVVGQTYDQFLQAEIERFARERDQQKQRADRLAAAEAHLRRPAVDDLPLWQAADRRGVRSD